MLTEPEKPTVLIVDDEASLLRSLGRRLANRYRVLLADNGTEAISLARQSTPAAVLLDLWLPDISGIDVLGEVKRHDPGLPVIMHTGCGDADVIMQALNLGANHFLRKPARPDALDHVLQRVLAGGPPDSAGGTPRVDQPARLVLDAKTAEAVRVVTLTPYTTVLLLGPTGVGKSAIAELIHAKSARAEGRFVDINCAGVSEELLDAELFGYERGAFTDATRRKPGLMELADGGTLFLDEIGDMPLATQAKLLKAVESKRFRRLGGTETLAVRTRIIAATNVSLSERMKAGRFREDLFYRLHVMPIELPPLRRRTSDIPALAQTFVEEIAATVGKQINGVSPEALARLVAYPWPGNIRELRNVVERACIRCRTARIECEHLPESIASSQPAPAGEPPMSLEQNERQHIERALDYAENNKAAAARLLGIDVSTLRRKLARYRKVDTGSQLEVEPQTSLA